MSTGLSLDSIRHIMKFMSVRDAVALSRTSSRMHRALDNKALWIYYVKRDFGFDVKGDARRVYVEEVQFAKLSNRWSVSQILADFVFSTDIVNCCKRRNANPSKSLFFVLYQSSRTTFNGIFSKKRLEKLIEYGADINWRTETRDTVLSWVCRRQYTNRLRVVRTLLELGADPTIPDLNGHTPISYPIVEGLLND